MTTLTTLQFTIILAKAIWLLLLIGAIALLLIVKDILRAIVHGYKSRITRVKRQPAQVAQEDIAGDNRGVEEQVTPHSLHPA
jgi:hypothetical protein